MLTRRQALRNLSLGGGSLALAPFLRQLRAEDAAAAPKRFVFVIRSNGILPTEIQPQGLEHLAKPRGPAGWQTKPHDYNLAGYELHPAMTPLQAFKMRLTIFQGLSGKMCRGSHEAGFGALGAYAGKATPRGETIDAALGGLSDGIIPHLGFTMDNFGASMTYPRLSASAANKPLPYYADPMLAYAELFGAIASGGDARAANAIDRNLLDFMVDDVKRYQNRLSSREKEKLGHYLNGFEALQKRQAKLLSMKETLAKAAPELREDFTSKIEIERVKAHFDLAASSLIAGLTRVVTIRADHMSMRLTGLGLGSKTVHGIGHMIEGEKGGNGGQPFANGKGEFAVRATILKFHMQQIGQLATKLSAVREGDGWMLDNTVIVYMSDHGDRHHSKFYDWPMVVLGGAGGKLRTGRYLQVPGWGNAGNRTIANLYLSLLHAAGHPRDTFGDKDLQSPEHIDPNGPLAEWMA